MFVFVLLTVLGADTGNFALNKGEVALELIPNGLVTASHHPRSEIRLRDPQSGRVMKTWLAPGNSSLLWARSSGSVLSLRGTAAPTPTYIASLGTLEETRNRWKAVPGNALRRNTLAILGRDGRTLTAWIEDKFTALPPLPLRVTFEEPNTERASIVALVVSRRTACLTLWLPADPEATPRFRTLYRVGSAWQEMRLRPEHQFVPTLADGTSIIGHHWPLWALESENATLSRNDRFGVAIWDGSRLVSAQGDVAELSLTGVGRWENTLYVKESGSSRLVGSAGRRKHHVGRIDLRRPNRVEWIGKEDSPHDESLLLCSKTGHIAIISHAQDKPVVHWRRSLPNSGVPLLSFHSITVFTFKDNLPSTY